MSLSNETVTRPNGKTWRFHSGASGAGRRVRVQHTAAGPEVIVCRTHDLELAASMASVRWGAWHPGVEQPEGVRAWGRVIFGRPGRNGPTIFDTSPRIEHSDGFETRSFPITIFRLPLATEGAA